MRSLARHLTADEEHDALGCRPDSGHCVTRLGLLPRAALSGRTGASLMLASSALAVAAPAAAVADGVVVNPPTTTAESEEPVDGAEEADDPDVDTSEEPADPSLPDGAAAPVPGTSSSVAPSLEPPPSAAQPASPAPAALPHASPSPSPTAAAPTPTPIPTPSPGSVPGPAPTSSPTPTAAAPAPAPATPAPQPAASAPTTTHASMVSDAPARVKGKPDRGDARTARRLALAATPARHAGSATVARPRVAVGGEAGAAPTPAPAADGETRRLRVPAGWRRHRVASGETLWVIARGTMGSDASAAKVARYVDRLWTYNAERIGTGDPDVLSVGVKLVLPPRER